MPRQLKHIKRITGLARSAPRDFSAMPMPPIQPSRWHLTGLRGHRCTTKHALATGLFASPEFHLLLCRKIVCLPGPLADKPYVTQRKKQPSAAEALTYTMFADKAYLTYERYYTGCLLGRFHTQKELCYQLYLTGQI
jgi:hypothetical protein